MTSTPQTHQVMDIVELLLDDHREVRELLDGFDSVAVDQRDDYFQRLTTMLVQHEVAEEETVYPALRNLGPEAAQIADARIEEQAEAEQLLADMEKMSTSSKEFVTAFARLRSAVIEHAQNEEVGVFAEVRSHESIGDRVEMGERYTKAKATAPTHPHPQAPDTPPGNVLLGPVASIIDRVRDSFRS